MTRRARLPSSPAAPASSAATWSICCSSAAIGVRVIDNLVGGREANLAQHAGNPDLAFEQSRHPQPDQPGDPLFAGVDYVFHFAGIGDIVPSIERPIEYMSVNVQGTVHDARGCARHAGVQEVRLCGLVVLLRAGRDADPRGSSDRTAISLCAEQVSGRAGGVALAQGLPAAGQLDPHLQRLRHAVADLGRLRRRVRRVPQAEARGQAVHGGRRRHAAARFPLCHRCRARRSCSRPRARSTGEIWNLGAGNPQSVNRLVELLGGAGGPHSRSGRASRTAPGPISARSRATSAGRQQVQLRGGRRGACSTRSTIGAMRRCGTPDSIAKATKTVWFNTLSCAAGRDMMDDASKT